MSEKFSIDNSNQEFNDEGWVNKHIETRKLIESKNAQYKDISEQRNKIDNESRSLLQKRNLVLRLLADSSYTTQEELDRVEKEWVDSMDKSNKLNNELGVICDEIYQLRKILKED